MLWEMKNVWLINLLYQVKRQRCMVLDVDVDIDYKLSTENDGNIESYN